MSWSMSQSTRADRLKRFLMLTSPTVFLWIIAALAAVDLWKFPYATSP
jgi:hypothetical protein